MHSDDLEQFVCGQREGSQTAIGISPPVVDIDALLTAVDPQTIGTSMKHFLLEFISINSQQKTLVWKARSPHPY
jgi:hypothetical protein